MHDHIGAAEGARRLKRITGAPPRHAVWQRIVIVASCSFFASSVVFSGSFVRAALRGCSARDAYLRAYPARSSTCGRRRSSAA
jgi:uncharacterized membrane protein YjjP (DUF1212 family)